MTGNICIFEDKRSSRLLPLVHTRAVYELRCGMDTLMDKIIRMYPGVKVSLFCREYLEKVVRQRCGYKVNGVQRAECLFINGKLIMDVPVPVAGDEEIGITDNTLVYARLGKENAALLNSSALLQDGIIRKLGKRVKIKKIKVSMINNLWDIIQNNENQIIRDYKVHVKEGAVKGKVYDGACIINRENVYIGRNAKIMPGVVINAEGGPVYIGEDATVMSNAIIEGPVYIGKKTIIKACAKIYEGVSIGDVCKVGGEVEGSIIHSYSNKQHEGFLGHSYIGMWVNIAAATDNSDLKNNYSNVKVYVEGKYVDSGSLFVGMFVGDYTKTSIGSKIYSGSVIGIMCNILGVGIPEKFLPSFVWEESEKMVTYNLKKALITTEKVMKRRNKRLLRAEEKMIEDVYKLTKNERLLTTK